HGDPVHERDGADTRAVPPHGLLEGLEEDGQGEERADGHGDDDEGRDQNDPAVGQPVHDRSILPSRTGMRRQRFRAITTPSAAHGTPKPRRRCTASPKSGGQTLTPSDEMESPRPTAVPAPRGPTSSARSVCCTPFQPMPKNPKASASGASTQAPVCGPLPPLTSEQAAEPTPRNTDTHPPRPPTSPSQ